MTTTNLLGAVGNIKTLDITISGDAKFDDTIIALRKAGTLGSTSDAHKLRQHTDGYKIKLMSTWKDDLTTVTNKKWFNCVSAVTTPVATGAYCVYAAVAGTAGKEEKYSLNWAPLSTIGVNGKSPADNVTGGYTFGINTTGLDRF